MATRGMSIIPESSGGIRLAYGAFIYVMVFVLLHGSFIRKFYKSTKLLKPILFFLIFIVTSIFFSIFYYQFPPLVCVTVGMRYFIVLAVFVFGVIDFRQYGKLIRILFYITYFTSILYILQCIFGVQLLAYTLEVHDLPTANGLYRFYNTPPFCACFLYISFFYKEVIPKKLRLTSPVIFLLVVFLSNGRTAIAVTALTLVLISIIIGKFKQNIRVFIIIAIVLIPIYPLVMERMDNDGKTAGDIEYIMAGKIYAGNPEGGKGDGMTMLYRLAWIYERWEYLEKKPFVERLFGLGMVHDDVSQVKKKYRFRYGLVDRNSGAVQQIRTPDIAWGNFLTCYGLLGSFLFFVLYYRIISDTYLLRKGNTIAAILFSMLIMAILGSFSGALLSEPYNLIDIFLLFNYLLINDRTCNSVRCNSMLQRRNND